MLSCRLTKLSFSRHFYNFQSFSALKMDHKYRWLVSWISKTLYKCLMLHNLQTSRLCKLLRRFRLGFAKLTFKVCLEKLSKVFKPYLLGDIKTIDTNETDNIIHIQYKYDVTLYTFKSIINIKFFLFCYIIQKRYIKNYMNCLAHIIWFWKN